MSTERRPDALLAAIDAKALVVIADSPRDPYLAPFVGPARLTRAMVIAPRGRAARLAFESPMERLEAARSGLDLLTPEQLDVERWSRGGAGQPEQTANVLSRALHLLELAPGRIALTGRLPAGVTGELTARLGAEGWSFVPGEAVVETLRKHKTADDVAEIRRVASAVGEAFRHVAALLAAAVATASAKGGELRLDGERLRVGRLAAEVSRILAEHRLEQAEGVLIAPGAVGAVPHTEGDPQRALLAGESLIVDIFPRGRLFADCTRTFCAGEAPAALAAAHAEVREALSLAYRAAVPGRRGWEVQETVCEHFRLAGYPTPVSHPGTTRGYVHGLGHGVGFEIHELPSFREHAGPEGVLEDGDVFTLEPGLYDPDAGWGVRLEDTVHLDGGAGDGGACVRLTDLPDALDPRAW